LETIYLIVFLSLEIVVAGPTNPLSSKRVQILKPTKFSEEPLNLQCEWEKCTFITMYMDVFMDHVAGHVPFVEVVVAPDCGKLQGICS